MNLRVIGTGSSGNCYVLEAGDSFLLLDAGVKMSQIREAIPKPSKIAACLVTHEHMDHARLAPFLASFGVPVVMSAGTGEALEQDGLLKSFKYVLPRVSEQFGDFTVLPFETQHDAKQPLGFLVRYDPTGETLLYATDTYYLAYTFPGIHYWIVECNYIDDIINQSLEDGELSATLRKRLLRSHMSLRRLNDALRANDLSKTRKIVLVHLSDQRSDEVEMVESVRRETGIEDVVAAAAGMEIPLELNPF